MPPVTADQVKLLADNKKSDAENKARDEELLLMQIEKGDTAAGNGNVCQTGCHALRGIKGVHGNPERLNADAKLALLSMMAPLALMGSAEAVAAGGVVKGLILPLIGGHLGGHVSYRSSKTIGASNDVADVAGFVGSIVGGGLASTRAFMPKPGFIVGGFEGGCVPSTSASIWLRPKGGTVDEIQSLALQFGKPPVSSTRMGALEEAAKKLRETGILFNGKSLTLKAGELEDLAHGEYAIRIQISHTEDHMMHFRSTPNGIELIDNGSGHLRIFSGLGAMDQLGGYATQAQTNGWISRFLVRPATTTPTPLTVGLF